MTVLFETFQWKKIVTVPNHKSLVLFGYAPIFHQKIRMLLIGDVHK